MTSRTDVDRLIERWLAAGSDGAPPDRVGAALLEVATTPQRHPVSVRLTRSGLDTMRPAAVVAIAIAFAALLGLGFAVRVGVIRLPAPNVIPSPNDRTYELPAAGFAITLSEEWKRTSERAEREFAAERDEMRLFIASGDEDGAIRICDVPAGRWEDCTRTRVNGLAGLVVKARPLIGGVRESRSTLDGEPATVIRVTTGEPGGRGGQLIVYVMTTHHGRPFVARLWAGEGPVEAVEDMLGGFEFLDPPVAGSRTFRYPAAGFELTLDGSWNLTSGRNATAMTASAGSGELRVYVSSADANGAIRTCATPAGPWETCDRQRVTNEDSLLEAVAIRPIEDHGVAPGAASFERSVLDGEPATLQLWDGYEHLSNDGQAMAWLVAMHDGRAFVMRIHTRSPSLPMDVVEAIVDGFRFTAPDEPTTYDITIPDGWVQVDAPLAGIRAYAIVEGSRTWPGLTVAVERDDGVLDLCVIRCASLEGIDTIDALREALRDERVLAEPLDTPYGPRVPRVTWWIERHETTIGGEPARIERPVAAAPQAASGQYAHVYAVHDGRAVVLSFDYASIRTGRISDETIEAILASFVFTD